MNYVITDFEIRIHLIVSMEQAKSRLGLLVLPVMLSLAHNTLWSHSMAWSGML